MANTAGTAVATTNIADDLTALRRGEITGRIQMSVVQIQAGRSAPPGALAELRGFAYTAERPRADDPDDLDPARTVRRALADGRMNAVEIGYGCAWEEGSETTDRAAAALQRGLGRFGSTMVLETSEDALGKAVEWARRGGSVALLIQPGVGSIALAFGRP